MKKEEKESKESNIKKINDDKLKMQKPIDPSLMKLQMKVPEFIERMAIFIRLDIRDLSLSVYIIFLIIIILIFIC
jgi:hypothetical protein